MDKKSRQPIIMRYMDDVPFGREMEYKDTFVVYHKTGDSLFFGEYVIFQKHDPERLHGTPYFICKKYNNRGAKIPMKLGDVVEMNQIADAKMRGVNIIEVTDTSDINILNAVIKKHAQNIYGVSIADIFWDKDEIRRQMPYP